MGRSNIAAPSIYKEVHEQSNFIPYNLYCQTNLKVCQPWCTPIPLGQSRLSCPRPSSWVGGPCHFFPKDPKDHRCEDVHDPVGHWQENKWRVLVLFKASFYYTILLIENKCPGSKGKISYYNQIKFMFYRQRFWLLVTCHLINILFWYVSIQNIDGLRFLPKIIFKLSTSKRLQKIRFLNY